MTRTVLALSPHLDDAAFSCGGTLAALADAGCRVIVATVFTRSVPNPTGFALACQLDKGLTAGADYMALRRNEDTAAMQILGATPRWLDLPEAPHRGYRSAPELFAARRLDDGVAEALVPMLRDIIEAESPSVILAPRAIGDHVDHHVVRDALRALEQAVPILWWTDYPYALKVRSDGERLHAIEPSASCRAKRIEASCAYESQIGFQFGGTERLRQMLDGHPAELFEADAIASARLHALLGVKLPA